MNNSEIWQAVLAELELNISKANFNTWFKDTGIIYFKEGEIIICVPNMFTKAWIEKKYHPTIIKSLERITGKPLKKLEYKIENIKNLSDLIENEDEPTESIKEASIDDFAPDTTINQSNNGFSLNKKYSFDTFVVGPGVELAYAAAQAVVNKPGEAYNPLFIYGGVGLGKTHLLQSIGNELIKKNPGTRIMYASAEKFSNDFIDSIKNGTAKDFQNRYRDIDVLLIDDIQFVAGKDKTQESFFHTFNELHQQNKQVVLTSDRPPKAIPALEDRLKSRFEWGMIVDVASPDFETRVAILQKKAQEKNFEVDENILHTIASNVQRNIRELEGALNKIIAYHELKNIKPTESSVKSLLTNIENSSRTKSVSPQQVIDTVVDFYSLKTEDVTGKSREKRLSIPRQIIMFLLREELNMSYPAIGEELGGRDHTTAMHAHTKIQNNLEEDSKLKQEIELIKQRLYIDNV